MQSDEALRYQAKHCQRTLMQVARHFDARIGLMLALMAIHR